jgi:hypothetical protein
VTTDPKLLPSNIREFNEITAVIFGKLYESFPEPLMIDMNEAATRLGITVLDKLPSGGV